MKKLLLSIVIFISFQITKADPGNYYNGLDTNQTCANFKTALFHLISSNYTQITYNDVKSAYAHTDMHKSDDGLRDIIWDMYSDNPAGPEPYEYPFTTVYPSTITAEGMGLNREHIFPQSWFDPNNVTPDPVQKSDLFHVLPSDGWVNGQKSNYPLGKVNNSPSFVSLNGSKVGFADTSIHFTVYSSNTYKNKVFEPRNEYKGDFARAYLYIITRYEDDLTTWNANSSNAKDVLDGNKYPGLDSWILKLCVSWCKLDPPSAKEIKRNDSVFAIQGNRNPYIDHPNWVEKVFGVNGSANCLVLATKQHSNTFKFTIYPNPVQDGFLSIDLDRNVSNNATFEVIDIVGRKLIEQKMAANNKQLTIDVSSLAKGTYLLNIIDDGNNSIQKFIKE